MWKINPQCLETAVEYVLHSTGLIVAVDLFGQPADLKEIRQIADRYKLLQSDCKMQSGRR